MEINTNLDSKLSNNNYETLNYLEDKVYYLFSNESISQNTEIKFQHKINNWYYLVDGKTKVGIFNNVYYDDSESGKNEEVIEQYNLKLYNSNLDNIMDNIMDNIQDNAKNADEIFNYLNRDSQYNFKNIMIEDTYLSGINYYYYLILSDNKIIGLLYFQNTIENIATGKIFKIRLKQNISSALNLITSNNANLRFLNNIYNNRLTNVISGQINSFTKNIYDLNILNWVYSGINRITKNRHQIIKINRIAQIHGKLPKSQKSQPNQNNH